MKEHPELTPLRGVDTAAPRRTDVMSAGRTLVLIVVALGAAAIMNSGNQARRASLQPLGPARDRALAIWEPISDVSRPIGLQLPRQALDEIRSLFGSEPPAPGPTVTTTPPAEVAEPSTVPSVGAPEPAPASTTTTTEVAARVPTAEDPLRVALVGDSTMEGLGQPLQRRLADTGVAISTLDARKSSGFSRPDFFDWPAHLALIIPEQQAEVVVAMFGGNDGQGFAVDGSVYDFGTPEWVAEYSARVNGAMQILAADGRKVFWVGQPNMRSDSFDAKMMVIDQIFSEQAALVPGVQFVDSRILLTPDGYRASGPSSDGSEKRLRADDGIHLTANGGDVIALAIMNDLFADGVLPEPQP